MSAEDMGIINTVIAGVAISLGGLGIERMWSYFRKRHDTLMKNNYDISTLFDDVNGLKESVDENSKKQEETSKVTLDIAASVKQLVVDTKKLANHILN